MQFWRFFLYIGLCLLLTSCQGRSEPTHPQDPDHTDKGNKPPITKLQTCEERRTAAFQCWADSNETFQKFLGKNAGVEVIQSPDFMTAQDESDTVKFTFDSPVEIPRVGEFCGGFGVYCKMPPVHLKATRSGKFWFEVETDMEDFSNSIISVRFAGGQYSYKYSNRKVEVQCLDGQTITIEEKSDVKNNPEICDANKFQGLLVSPWKLFGAWSKYSGCGAHLKLIQNSHNQFYIYSPHGECQ